MMTTVHTDIYRLPRSRFARTILLDNRKWVYAGCSAVVICMAVSAFTYDLRWGIIALMILLLIMPLMLSIAYYANAFRPLSVYNLLEHSISADRSGLTVIIRTDSAAGEENSEPVIRKIHYHWKELKNYRPSSDSITLSFGSENGGFIIIPFSTFNSTEDVSAFVDFAFQQTNNAHK